MWGNDIMLKQCQTWQPFCLHLIWKFFLLVINRVRTQFLLAAFMIFILALHYFSHLAFTKILAVQIFVSIG